MQGLASGSKLDKQVVVQGQQTANDAARNILGNPPAHMGNQSFAKHGLLPLDGGGG